MSDKSKTHWPSVFTIYLIISAALAVGANVLRHHSLPAEFASLRSASEGFLIVGAIVAVLLFWLYWKTKVVRALMVFHFKLLRKFWHLVLGWIGAGLASYAIAAFVPGAHAPNPLVAAITGPLTGLFTGRTLLVLIGLIAYTLVVEEFLRVSEVGKSGDGKAVTPVSIVKKFQDMSDNEYAPKERPKGAHFADADEEVAPFVIRDDEKGRRTSLGLAELAPKRGKKKRTVEVGLPIEGSMNIIGAPGAGKTLLLVRIILAIVRAVPSNDPKKNIPITKAIVTSTKLDMAAATVKHLRSQGLKVLMLDLTGNEGNFDGRYGTPVRWSPLSLCLTTETGAHTATRLIESVKDSDSKDRADFWAIQAGLLLYPNLRAAVLAKKDLEWAYRSTLRWSDETFNETDHILYAAGADDELLAWQGTRKMLLAKDKGDDLAWKEQHGLSGAGGTGLSIDATLRGVMGKLMNEKVYAATTNPNLDIREFIRNDEAAILFLVGSMSGPDEYVTRSIECRITMTRRRNE